MNQERQRRETAEIQRSRSEALHAAARLMIADERNVARYLQPPANTAYPLEYAYSLLADIRDRTVVDFGCGAGDNSLLLARRGARVVGIDISESLLSLAAQRMRVNGLAGRAGFVTGSAHDLPIRDACADVVFGIAILHHLDLAATAQEVHRILKPGGTAIFQEPVRDSRLVRGARRLIPYRAPDVSPFERPLTTPELRAFTSGFTVLSWRTFSLPFVNLTRALPRLRRYSSPAYALDRALLARFPALRRFSGIHVFAIAKQESAAGVGYATETT